MGNVTQYPTGLLDLLRVRDRGQMPADLEAAVQGGIDLTQFYLNNQQLAVTDSIAAPAAVGFNATNDAGVLAVPAGEVWFVHSFSVGVTLTAAQGIDFAAAIRTPGPVNHQLGDWDRVTPLAATLAWTRAQAPFWALAGTIFGALVGRLTAGPMTLVGAVRVTKLRA